MYFSYTFCLITFSSFNFQEEREKRLEEMLESDLGGINEASFGFKQELPEEGSARSSAKITHETLTKADLLIEALDIADVELKRLDEHEVLPFVALEFLIYSFK